MFAYIEERGKEERMGKFAKIERKMKVLYSQAYTPDAVIYKNPFPFLELSILQHENGIQSLGTNKPY